MAEELVVIPENLDAVIFGSELEIGKGLSERLISEEIPHFAPPPGLVALGATEYVKMLLEGLKPKLVINAVHYSGDEEDFAIEANSLIPFSLTQACEGADVPWVHIRIESKTPLIEKTINDGLRAISNSDSDCEVIKMYSKEEIESGYDIIIEKIKSS